MICVDGLSLITLSRPIPNPKTPSAPEKLRPFLEPLCSRTLILASAPANRAQIDTALVDSVRRDTDGAWKSKGSP